MSPGDRRHREERVLRWSAGVLVGFLLVGTALVAASYVFHVDDDAQATVGSDHSGRAPTASAPGTTSLAPASSPTAAPRMTSAQMTTFLRRYLATAPRDQRTAWRLLTPGFQRASRGFSAYAGFWGPIDTATPFGIFADPATRRITYRVRYTYPSGRTLVDNTRLELRLNGADVLRIAGEG